MSGEVGFAPEERDYIDAARANFSVAIRRPRFLRGWAIFTLIAALFGLGLGWVLGLSNDSWSMAAGYGALAFVLLPLLSGISLLLLPRRVRRLFQQQHRLNRHNVFTWNDREVSLRSDIGAQTLDWNGYYAWSENTAMFLFYLNEQLYQFLPKRVLTDDQITDLRRCIQAGRQDNDKGADHADRL